MPIEQEPIKIEIPVEEEEVVMRPERRSAPAVAERVEDGARRVGQRAEQLWESEKRQEVQARLKRGAVRGARGSQRVVVWGLRWLSGRLADVADRFTPLEEESDS